MSIAIRHLQELGLSEHAAALYNHLLTAGTMPSETAGSALTFSSDQLEQAVAELESLALASRDGELVTPLDPEAGLRALSGRINSRLDVSIQIGMTAYETYRRSRNTGRSHNVVEILEGADIQRAVAELERSAVSQIRAFDTPPYGTTSLVNPIELANLERGVSYRVAYAREAIEDTERFQHNIQPCIEAGEVARSMAKVPAKMIIADDRVALVGLTSTHADQHHTALLVHQCSVLPALSELFELCWRAATPLSGAPATNHDLKPVERLLLRHLAAGLTDEVAARNLGISKRTVARYIERLADLAGASSRFQLAIHAQRHGWIA